MTQQEITEQINAQYTIIFDRKGRLSSTDYIGNKIVEKVATIEEYADKIAERQQWRLDINNAEDEIKRLEGLEPDPELMPNNFTV